MNKEITYPHSWEWRLIVEYNSLSNAINETREILSVFDPLTKVSTGTSSTNKKFCTININATVQSKTMVEQIAKLLSKIPGYKILL